MSDMYFRVYVEKRVVDSTQLEKFNNKCIDNSGLHERGQNAGLDLKENNDLHYRIMIERH